MPRPPLILSCTAERVPCMVVTLLDSSSYIFTQPAELESRGRGSCSYLTMSVGPEPYLADTSLATLFPMTPRMCLSLLGEGGWVRTEGFSVGCKVLSDSVNPHSGEHVFGSEQTPREHTRPGRWPVGVRGLAESGAQHADGSAVKRQHGAEGVGWVWQVFNPSGLWGDLLEPMLG